MEILFIILSPVALLCLCVVIVRRSPATSRMPTCMDSPEVQLDKIRKLTDPSELRAKVTRDSTGRMVSKTVGLDHSTGSTFILTKTYGGKK